MIGGGLSRTLLGTVNLLGTAPQTCDHVVVDIIIIASCFFAISSGE